MPLCTLHLLALHSTSPLPLQNFLSTLHTTNLKPLVISRVIRWIILPQNFSTEHLLARNIHWDILLILHGTDPLPPPLRDLVQHQWSITAGVPSRLIQDFAEKNRRLLKPQPGTVPKLSAADEETTNAENSSQNLELSPELSQWIKNFSNNDTNPESRSAVSMLNLLSFIPSKKPSYLEYGKAFATSAGKKHGGNAKIVGGVTATNSVPRSGKEDGEGWDEIALAHYPSIAHFAEMLGDEEYQEVNKRCRLPALRDTAILMTSEVGIAEMMDRVRGRL